LLIFCIISLISQYKDIVSDAGSLFAIITIIVTTVSGIYLFVVGRNKRLAELESTITQNATLELKIEQAKLKQQLAEGGDK
jgi:hypothetical protein